MGLHQNLRATDAHHAPRKRRGELTNASRMPHGESLTSQHDVAETRGGSIATGASPRPVETRHDQRRPAAGGPAAGPRPFTPSPHRPIAAPPPWTVTRPGKGLP